MTQYVYGKNVVKQLLQDGKPIHEVLIQEGIRDTALEGEIKKRRIPVKVLGRKKMDQLLNGNHQGITRPGSWKSCWKAFRRENSRCW